MKTMPNKVFQSSLWVLVILLLCAPTPTPAADAAFESWIAGVGGSLRRDAAGEIVAVDLASTWVANTDLARIGALSALREIDLSHTRITDIGFDHLKSLEEVRKLTCRYCDYLTDGAIVYLKKWRKLQHLDLQGSDVTSRVFEHIAQMTELKSLNVRFSRVNDAGFDALAPLEQLEELHIGGNKMTGLALPLLRFLPSLKYLNVNGSQRTDSGRWGLTLTDANIGRIGDLSQLERLDMGGAQVSDGGMAVLERLGELRVLDLSRSELTSAGLEPLTRLTKLRRLSLWASERIDDRAAEHLLKMETLEVLDLGETSISGATLDRLIELRSLKELFVGGSNVTREDIGRFRQARPDCRLTWWPKQEKVESQEDTRLIG